MGDKVRTERGMLMNIANFILTRYCGGSFCPKFQELLNKAKINTNPEYQQPNTPEASKYSTEIWPEEDEMPDVFADAKRFYIALTKLKDFNAPEYEEEMTISME